MGASRIIGAVDIGTSKAVAVIGEVVAPGRPEILGFGESSISGIRKGEIIDLATVSNCVHAAISAAETKAKLHLTDMCLSQSGTHIGGMESTGSVNVASADNRVSQNDMRRAAQDAKSKELPGGRVYINHAINAYRLDGQAVGNPLGMEGRRLEVDYWHIYGDESKIRDRISILTAYNLNTSELIFSGIAAGGIAATETERRMGVLVLDIGAGTTEYVYYRNGYPCLTGVIPVGGDHLTNDLAYGLRIGNRSAEKLKINLGSAFPDAINKDDKVWILGDKNVGDRQIRHEAIAQIIAARAGELFEMVKAELGNRADPELMPGGVVLTGGSSKLDGLDLLAGRVFGVSARRSEPPPGICPELAKPEYSVVLGLLKLGSAEKEKIADDAAAKKGVRGLFSRLLGGNK